MGKESFSFKLGWSQVKNGDIRECRNDIMNALNITTRAAWAHRLNGDIEPRISEVRAIETVFAKYGIKNVWGVA